MAIRNRPINFKTGIIISLVLSFILFSGCLFNPANVSSSQPVPVDGTTYPAVQATTGNASQGSSGSPEENQGPPVFGDISALDSINITVHSVNTTTIGTLTLVILDISLTNKKIQGGFYVYNWSLFCLEQTGGEGLKRKTEDLPPAITNPLLPGRLPSGQEKRGTVVYEVWEKQHVQSIVLYVTYPNGTFVGESAIRISSGGPANRSQGEVQKTLGLVVHSATQQHTMPGWPEHQSGISIAVINVSITNHGTTPVLVQRENIFIQTNRGRALEHGGDRAPPELAGNFLRFPLSVAPNETKTGPVVYLVYSGTKVNTLVLTDRNFAVNSFADLNQYYVYL